MKTRRGRKREMNTVATVAHNIAKICKACCLLSIRTSNIKSIS